MYNAGNILEIKGNAEITLQGKNASVRKLGLGESTTWGILSYKEGDNKGEPVEGLTNPQASYLVSCAGDVEGWKCRLMRTPISLILAKEDKKYQELLSDKHNTNLEILQKPNYVILNPEVILNSNGMLEYIINQKSRITKKGTEPLSIDERIKVNQHKKDVRAMLSEAYKKIGVGFDQIFGYEGSEDLYDKNGIGSFRSRWDSRDCFYAILDWPSCAYKNSIVACEIFV